MSFILEEEVINDLKLKIAFLHIPAINWISTRLNLMQIADWIGAMDDPQEIDDWCESCHKLILQGDYQSFKNMVRDQLVRKEAYLEIIELNLQERKILTE